MLELATLRAKVFFYSLSLCLVLFAILPTLWMLSTSLKPLGEVFSVLPSVIPKHPTLEHYSSAFSQYNVGTYFKNSMIVAVATAVLCLAVSSYAAYSFSRYSFRGRKSLLFLILFAQMFPWSVLVIALYLMMSRLHLLDSYFALVMSSTTFTLPLTIWILKSYFDTIPRDVFAAARIDGAGEITVIHRIALPLAAPGFISTGIFAFVTAWNNLLFPLTLTHSKSMRTLPPGLLMSYLGQFQANWPGIMAASLIASLPVAVMFIAFQRFFISGLTAGAVK
jgi:multiple sugar transport system permease protein